MTATSPQRHGPVFASAAVVFVFTSAGPHGQGQAAQLRPPYRRASSRRSTWGPPPDVIVPGHGRLSDKMDASSTGTW